VSRRFGSGIRDGSASVALEVQAPTMQITSDSDSGGTMTTTGRRFSCFPSSGAQLSSQ
jgi:hypothetical protein